MYSTHPNIGNSSEEHFEELVKDGIAAAKTGHREEARRCLQKATLLKPADARPWLWLSATTDNTEEQRKYLECAVAADPTNAAARRGLVMLSSKADTFQSTETSGGSSLFSQYFATQPQEASAQTFLCPQCGGHMSFDIQKGGLACHFCGFVQAVNEQLAADEAERPIDYTLPTRAGHDWARTQRRVSCEQCGAVSLLPPTQKTDQCPYCGSNRLVEASADQELVEPQVIAVMRLDQEEVSRRVKQWLSKGFAVPDDLTQKIRSLKLRPAYYPFWTFDGSLEVGWSCEVNVGTSKYPQWAPRSGREAEFFDDVLVPGMKAFSLNDMKDIEPFNLKDLVEFQPEYVAGWPTLTYDRSLAEASLMARQRVIQPMHISLPTSVEPGYEKRNFRMGAGEWSGLTFKHVLLPLWVGMYHYRGKEYRLLVNGQTGKVSGEKPRDAVKIAAILAAILLTLTALGLLAYVLWAIFGR